jgi:hypothetical protein
VATLVRLVCQLSTGANLPFLFILCAAVARRKGYALGKESSSMGGSHGPDFLLHSLIELRPSEAKRRFRRSILEDYPLRGPMGQPACAYCGKWHEKLTLDHIVPKSKGGPHYAKWNIVPACFNCNSKKSNSSVFEWWRPLDCWSEEREQMLLAWVHSNSFVSAHTDIQDWESWMEAMQRVVPVHERMKEAKEKAAQWPPSLSLRLAS